MENLQTIFGRKSAKDYWKENLRKNIWEKIHEGIKERKSTKELLKENPRTIFERKYAKE